MHPMRINSFPMEMAAAFVDSKRLWSLPNGAVIKGEMIIEILLALAQINTPGVLAELRTVVLVKEGKSLSAFMQKALKPVLQIQGTLKPEVQEFLKECFTSSLSCTLPEKYISSDLEYHLSARL